ncbi:MAG: acetylglutamate kinase [Candidatus Xenobia bacterium]
MLTIKLGGNELDVAGFLPAFAGLLARHRPQCVIVHGGGKGTSALSARLGITARFSEGLRITDDATRAAAVMGLAGTASTQVVQALVQAGVAALGLTGIDAGLVRVRRLERPGIDLGWVGVPEQVDAVRLSALLQAGFVPCLAPLSLGPDGEIYNVNADPVAAAVAAALCADALVFLTTVPGVLVHGQAAGQISPEQVEALVADGTVSGGMIPKVRAAAEAVAAGVSRVLITDLTGLAAWLEGRPAGTEVSHARAEHHSGS